METITQAVVLAAGTGDRLRARTNGRAKCLVPVDGRPLIDYVLSSLRQAGVSDVLIVVGEHGPQVEAHLCAGARHGLGISYARNHDCTRGNASSLFTALPHLDAGPFLLVMSDHLCSPDLLRALAAGAGDGNAIAVDRSPLPQARADEATKVDIEGERIVALGKQLGRWEAVDTGFSRWIPDTFAALDAHADGELAALMSRVAGNGSAVAARDVSGHPWLDVDTEDDLREAERLVRAHGRLFA